MAEPRQVTYCGLYCGLCAQGSRIPKQASALRESMRREAWDRWGQEIPRFKEFWAFLDCYKDLPTLEETLLDPKKTAVPTKPSAMYAVTTMLTRNVSKDKFDRILTYMARLPKEFEVMGVRDCIRADKEITQTTAYVEWAVANKNTL